LNTLTKEKEKPDEPKPIFLSFMLPTWQLFTSNGSHNNTHNETYIITYGT